MIGKASTPLRSEEEYFAGSQFFSWTVTLPTKGLGSHRLPSKAGSKGPAFPFGKLKILYVAHLILDLRLLLSLAEI